MMVSDITGSPVPQLAEQVVLLTVIWDVAETTPVNPFMLAVMGMEPGPMAVTRPVELTVATELAGELQVTRLVTSWLLEG
jgi:hypothetical protein